MASKEQAFANLRLDDAFFQKMMRLDGSAVEDDQQDFDIYLMEKGVMPVLVQGLDALSRHYDKMSNKKPQVPFNPRLWLAQYLLRNHPAKVKDHRTPMYKQLGEMANIERGRRSLLRRKGEFQEVWYEKAQDGVLTIEGLPALLQHLDKRWLLDGLFLRRFPHQPYELEALLKLGPGVRKVKFEDFWQTFEKYVSTNDILRVSDFEDALRRKAEAERKAKEEKEQAVQRKVQKREMKEQSISHREQFSSLCADMYTSHEISHIMNKGATIRGFQLPDEPFQAVVPEGEVALQGDHIELLICMLRLWGSSISDSDEDIDVWTKAASEAWAQWVAKHGPPSAKKTVVDSVSLKKMIDADAYEEYLAKAFPFDDDSDDEDEQTVEVRAIVDSEDKDGEVFVEAVDEATGHRLRLKLPANEVLELRQRLESSRGQPVYAQADRVTNQVLALHPETTTPIDMATPDIPEVFDDDEGDDDDDDD